MFVLAFGAIIIIKCSYQAPEQCYMDTCTLYLGTAGWSRNGHQVRFEFALGIRNCDCKRIASNCLFLNLEAILGGGVGERVTSLTEGRVRSRIREAEVGVLVAPERARNFRKQHLVS